MATADVPKDNPELADYEYGFHYPTDDYAFKSRKGIDREIVLQISAMKKEPKWMTDFRLEALDIFNEKPLPTWGGDLTKIDFQDIYYYMKASEQQETSWDEVPDDIRKTYDRLGIPEAEQKFLSGVKAQYESEVVYGSLQEDLAKQGVIFTDTDSPTFLLSELTRRQGVYSLPEAVHRITQASADVLGLKDRGTLREGFIADINVIDYDGLELKSPEYVYDFPNGAGRWIQKADGYDLTVVNGEVFMRDGEHQGALAGRVIRA